MGLTSQSIAAVRVQQQHTAMAFVIVFAYLLTTVNVFDPRIVRAVLPLIFNVLILQNKQQRNVLSKRDANCYFYKQLRFVILVIYLTLGNSFCPCNIDSYLDAANDGYFEPYIANWAIQLN